ncbi:MAG: PAS domain S-box protein [bacterium]
MVEKSPGLAIIALQEQIAEVNRRVAEKPSQLIDGLAESLQELLGIIEELRITQEELQRRTEDLTCAHQAIEAERLRYRSLFESIPCGCLLTDSAGVIKEANQAAADMLCVDRGELIGKTLITFTAAKSRQALNSHLQKIEEGCMVQELKMLLKPLGRPTFSASVTTAALPSSQAGLTELCWMMRTLPDRKRAEAALRQSEDRYQLFFEEDLTGEFIATADGQILACNPAFARIFGFASVEEAMNCNLDSLYPDRKDKEAYFALLQREKKIDYHETELRRRDGQPVQLIEKALGTFDTQGKLIELKGYLFDITERKSLEDQLRQSQKMEAITRLANRVAHDFNNLLVGIKSYSDLLLRHLDPHNPLRKDIEEIQNAGERASSLTQQLLTFSRKQAQRLQLIDLHAVITGMDIQSLIGPNINLTIACGPDLGLVRADPMQIEQVLTNLLINARDAMSENGRLNIKMVNVHLDEIYTRQHVGVQTGPHVMLSVSDNGMGMNEETKSRLFEPFFTTKRQDKAKGLGLSTVYSIIQQSGGHITVSSRLGQGTTFKIYLPGVTVREHKKSSRPSASSHGSARLLHRGQKGSETVLLVEDEESVRTAICMILKKFGYTVLEAHQGEEAMMICKQHQGPIHLLLTDITMPQMSGMDLAGHIQSLHPGMMVIFMSGNLNVISDQQNCSGLNLLPKPFVLDDLLSRVRQVLDEAKSRKSKARG